MEIEKGEGDDEKRRERDPRDQREHHFYSEMVRISLPTPDFSMPYNVIVITSTVVVSFFGQVLSLLLVRLDGVSRGEEVKNEKMAYKLIRVLKGWFKGGKKEEEEKEKEKEKEKDENEKKDESKKKKNKKNVKKEKDD